MTSDRAATTTILFSDLVGSTELLQRAGDEDAQRIFKAHYQLLRDAVNANGGTEVKWLGDGLMVAFNAAADAVRCAITMQQASRRPVAGEHLAIRVGINIGDALRDEGDYFGTPVVVARRLCDRADAGQILCSGAVSHVLAGRNAFSFNDLGPLALKGISDPVAACEAVYERGEAGAILARTPFVGRSAEVARLRQRFDDANAGRGGLVMLVGEPGIGKTRTSDEFAEWVTERGGRVLRGRCFEGDWAPPYGPFAEAIEGHVRDADPDQLRQDLGFGAAPIARLAPGLRLRLPEIAEPATLQPDEERFRLLDAVSQFLIAASERAPLLLMLDDLHWADRGTIGMMRHVARLAPGHRILVLGAYRDVELGRQHPLADALSALRREVEYDRILLKGLGRDEVGALLSTLAEQDVDAALVQAISDETDGNPFFIREVLAHLVDEGKLYREDGQWKSSTTSIADLGIPEGVRQVITRRLSHLSADANKLMTAASAFNGGFNFLTLSLITGLTEAATLDAIDEALAAQLLRPTGQLDHYDFTHALIRHTLYSEMNPSRQVRLHRQIAEAYEQRNQDDAAKARHAAEMAYQYHRSAAIPGAERGVEYALIAADAAERSAAWDEAVTFFGMALDLLTEGDERLPRTLGRRSIALTWALHFDEAVETATRAADALAEREGADAAGDFLAEVAPALEGAGHKDGAWQLAAKGVLLKAGHRDAAWVRLRRLDLARLEAADPSYIGIAVMTPERQEADDVARSVGMMGSPLISRNVTEERVRALATRPEGVAFEGRFNEAVVTVFVLGDARRGRELWAALADDYERSGRIVLAANACGQASRSCSALGLFEEGDMWLRRGFSLAARVGRSRSGNQLLGARYERAVMTGEGWERLFAQAGDAPVQPPAQDVWNFASSRADFMRGLAWLGRGEPAIVQLAELIAPLDLAPGHGGNYTVMACTAAETLWLLDRRDHIDTVERNLREKVVEPDFRYINVDGRTSLARLCALQGRYDEASRWFAEARAVLEEDGARPLRAIVDYDEALMYARRAAAGAQPAAPGSHAAEPPAPQGLRERALPLLDAAMQQFADIGMTGWTRRAEELRATLSPSP